MNSTTKRRYDPERRDRIIEAALEVIATHGVAGTTHRRVAEVADVPLGAMTYYFQGMEQLLQTIAKVRRQMNPKLKIDGILMTMVDGRTNNAKEITTLIRETYGGKIKVFETAIPHSVRAAEASLTGKSIFEYDPGGKVAQAYRALTKEVLQLEKQRQKAKSDLLR